MIDERLIQRFWDKVEKGSTDECWLWTASTAGKGYGQIKIPGTRKQIYAHRLSFLIHKGPIPDGADLRHTCDNPRCVNPKHLITGSRADNLGDMVARDRHLYGERNNQHRLTEEQVHGVFDLLEKGIPQSAIAKAMGIHQMTVSKIARGERWRHVWLKRR